MSRDITRAFIHTYTKKLYARARVKCGGGSDEESRLIVGIRLAVVRVVVEVAVVLVIVVVVVVV